MGEWCGCVVVDDSTGGDDVRVTFIDKDLFIIIKKFRYNREEKTAKR